MKFTCPNCLAPLRFIKRKVYPIDPTTGTLEGVPVRDHHIACTECLWKSNLGIFEHQQLYESIVNNPLNQGSFD